MNAWISVRIASVEVEILAGDGGTGASDLQLNAARVELSTTGRVHVECGVSLVEGNDLLAEKIFAGFERRGNCNIILARISLELVNSPLRAVEAILCDLSPDGRSAICCRVWSDVGYDGTFVATIDDVVVTVVMKPLDADLITGSCCDKASNFSTAVDITDKIRTGEVFDGAVVWWRSNVYKISVYNDRKKKKYLIYQTHRRFMSEMKK